MAITKPANPIPSGWRSQYPEIANFMDTTEVPGASIFLWNKLRAVMDGPFRRRERNIQDLQNTYLEIKNNPVEWTAKNISIPNTQSMNDNAALGIPIPSNVFVSFDTFDTSRATGVGREQVRYLVENNFDLNRLSENIKPVAVKYKLTDQILNQGTSGKWTGMGFGTPEKNALAMADMLSGAGITDIKQFGVLPGGGYGNKATGQAIDANYTRAGGNIWGGTFEGANSTGFGVHFGPDGTPYFYTQEGASTSDIGKVMPIVSLGLAIFAPGIGGAIGSALTGTAATTVASQVIGGAIVQGTLAELSGGDFLDAAITGAIMAGVAPAVANTVGSSVAQSMADSVFREVVVNATASAAASAVAAAVTGKDIGESALVGAVTGAAAPIGRLAGGTIAEAMNGAALTETVSNAVAGATSSAIAASILNKDVSDAALSGFVGGAASSIGRELGTAAEYGTDPFSEQNRMLLNQERGMGTSGAAGANLGSAAGAIALGADPMFSLINAAIKTGAESSLSQTRPGVSPTQNAQAETTDGTSIAQDAVQSETQSVAEANPLDAIAPGLKNIEDIFSGPSAQVAQSGDQNADLSVIDSILSGEPEPSTTTVTAPDGSQLVYDQDNNLVDIIEAPDTSVVAPEPLVPDASNPNLEPGKTPQERAADEWQRYLDSLTNKPADLDLPGSTIDAGEYFEEYDKNLKRIMDEGGYTSQWQSANGDKVFVNDDGTAIGINENGGTYSLSDTEVENMVNSGLLNTADSGYVEATGGTGNTPGGTAEDADKCGDGFHFDEARQICVPDEDKEPETQECPEGHVFDLNTQTCVPISIAQEDPSIRPSIKTVNQDVTRPPRSSSNSLFQDPLRGILGADVISRAIPDEPSNKLGLPVYGEMDKFEGPLDNFLKIVMGGSYVNNSAQQPQQAGNMNNPNQPDFLNQQPGYFNYGTDTNIDQNLFGGQNSLNNDQRLFGGQNSLNYDQQLFGGQNSMDYDRQLFANPNPFKAGGLAMPLMAEGGTTRYGKYAGGGLNVVEHSGKHRLDFRKGAAVTGAGDGQSDDIPAMLADGEFVFPADVVAALGNGSTKAGSDKLYDMMHAIRAYHRSAKPKDLPPPAKKSPLDYLKKPSRKARG
jgi:hypothetical protein